MALILGLNCVSFFGSLYCFGSYFWTRENILDMLLIYGLSAFLVLLSGSRNISPALGLGTNCLFH